jgi:hypothetical protein
LILRHKVRHAVISPLHVQRSRSHLAPAGTTKTLRLVVGDNTGAAAASEVVVGNCGAKDPGEFAFDVPADAKALGFTAEPGSGTVPAGQKVRVEFKRYEGAAL